MADVKWIKIATQVFDNRKIKQIEIMPEGDSIVVIWFKLLCLAGNINDKGLVYFTKEIPYTEQMLSAQFNRPLTTIQLALNLFQKFGMVEVIDNIIQVSSWEKYQNVDGMEKIKEQTKKRVAKYRENKRLAESNVTSNVTVTEGNATDIDIDIDIDIDKDINIYKDTKTKKNKYGEYKHVLLTKEEYTKLINELGNSIALESITYLDEYIEMKGYKAKSHYLCIKKWVIDAVNKKSKANVVQGKNTNFNNFQPGNYDYDDIEKKLLGWDIDG